MKKEPSIKTLKGKEIVPYIHKIAELRIAHFHEYPYLYDGDMAYEEKYLRMYAQTNDALLIVAENNDKIVGAITGLPLAKSMPEAIKLFKEKHVSTDGIFYLGELVIEKSHKNQKIESLIYQEFEKAVKKIGSYKKIAVCEVVRDEKDKKKPSNYVSIDHFWEAQGYAKQPDLIVHYSWKEIGATKETDHPMVFCFKNI